MNGQKRTWRKRLALGFVFCLLAWLPLAGCNRDQRPPPAPVSPQGTLPPRGAEPSPGTVSPAAKPAVKVSAEIKKTYAWYCAQCHGVEGKGDGINAHLLTVRPRDHTDAEYLETRADEQLFDVIKRGGLAAGRAPCMPAWGHTLDDAVITGLVAYVRELCRCQAN